MTRIFALLYAAAICVVAGVYVHINPDNWANIWVMGVAPALGFILVAAGQLAGARAPWVAALAVFCALQFPLWDRERLALTAHPEIPLLAFVVLIGGAWELTTRSASGPSRLRRTLRWILRPRGLMFAGALLVLASMLLPAAMQTIPNTDERVTGLMVLLRRARWVTSEIGIPSDVFGPSLPRLEPIFRVSGWAFYAVTVALAVATLGFAAIGALRGRELRSAAVSRLAAGALLCAAWAATDLFWGWHFELHEVSWSVYVALGCWAASLGFAAVSAARIARGRTAEAPRLILFLMPLIAFHCAVLSAYWEEYIRLSGLAALFLGSTAQAWGWTALLLGHPAEQENRLSAAA